MPKKHSKPASKQRSSSARRGAQSQTPTVVPTAAHLGPKPLRSGPAALVRIEEIHRRLKAVSLNGASTYRVTTQSLVEELGVSRNTVKDDFTLLGVFNAPIAYDGGRRTYYYTRPDFELRPPLWLGSEEVLALLVAIRLAFHSRAFPLGGALVSAFRKIAPMLAGAGSFGPDTLDPVFSTPDATANEAEARHFALLCEAIVEKRAVRIVYRKAKHDPTPETRLIHPLHWFIRPDSCLLIAHEPAIDTRRNFELVRMQEVSFTGETFEDPPGFDLQKYLAGGFGRFIGEAVHEVRVVFDRDFVPLVRERPWQPGEVLIDRPDGSAETTYRICHTADLEQQVLRAGGQVEVISPPEVRDRIRAAATRLLARHS